MNKIQGTFCLIPLRVSEKTKHNNMADSEMTLAWDITGANWQKAASKV